MQPNLLLVSKILPHSIIIICIHLAATAAPRDAQSSQNFGKRWQPERKCLTIAVVHIRAKIGRGFMGIQAAGKAELDENGEKPNNNSDTVWGPSK